MAAAAVCEFSGSATGLALAYEEACKGGDVHVFAITTWKKMWGAHASATKKVLKAMEHALKHHPDKDSWIQQFKTQLAPAMRTAAEVIEDEKKKANEEVISCSEDADSEDEATQAASAASDPAVTGGSDEAAEEAAKKAAKKAAKSAAAAAPPTQAEAAEPTEAERLARKAARKAAKKAAKKAAEEKSAKEAAAQEAAQDPSEDAAAKKKQGKSSGAGPSSAGASASEATPPKKRKADEDADEPSGQAKRTARVAERKENPLENALALLTKFKFDLLAATAKRGDAFLGVNELKALAEHKGVSLDKENKKEAIVSKLLASGVFDKDV